MDPEYELWEWLHNEHELTLLQSEFYELIDRVKEYLDASTQP